MEIILATPAEGRYHDNCDSGVGGLLQGDVGSTTDYRTVAYSNLAQPLSSVSDGVGRQFYHLVNTFSRPESVRQISPSRSVTKTGFCEI